MFLNFLTIIFVENILNNFLFRSTEMKTIHHQLQGKSLCIILKEFQFSLIFFFRENRIDILNSLREKIDCSITMEIKTLSKLRKFKELVSLIKSKNFKIEGDPQIIYNFIMLVNLTEFDLVELLVPYVGDVIAEGISRIFLKGVIFLNKEIQRQKRYISEVLEECRIAPGPVEVSWFSQEITVIERAVQMLDKHIENRITNNVK